MIRKDNYRLTFGTLSALAGLAAGLCPMANAQSADGPTPGGTIIGTTVTATYQPDTDGPTFTAASPPANVTVATPVATTAVYSLYNPGSDEFDYTANRFVHAILIRTHVWNDTGVIGYAPLTTADTGDDATMPIYLLYDFQAGALFFTSDPAECAYDVSQLGDANYGVVFSVFTTYADGRLPLYRLFSPTGPDGPRYFCTTSQTTHDSLVASAEWADAGILGYLKASH